MNVDTNKLLGVISDILTDRYKIQITAKERQETETNAINANFQNPGRMAQGQAGDNRRI